MTLIGPYVLKDIVGLASDYRECLWVYYKGNLKHNPSFFIDPIDSRNLSASEYDEHEDELHKNGYANFLNYDQIQDVISNLKSQNRNADIYSIENAILYYYENDSFLDLDLV
jgi:hypothetical protein